MAKTPDTGMLVKVTLFVPFTRGDLDGMSKAITTAKALTTKEGLAKIGEGIDIVDAEAREGTRPK